MPFGLDLKSVLIGALFVYFVLPYIMGALASRRTPRTAQTSTP